MKSGHFIRIAVLALAVACTENASTPVDNNQPAFAPGGNTANPKYSSSTYSLTSAKGLNHSWRQTGLGSFTNVPYLLTADATITAHCENKSGKNTVQGAPFDINQSLSSGPQTFPERNGSINGSLTLTPAGVLCTPPGQNPHAAIIDAVVYFNIRFCWSKTDVSATALQGPIPGGPGSGATVPPSPQTGEPLDGNQGGTTQAQLGIFATCVST
jgi:hypothetical protein